MNASWSEPFILETLDASWDTYPASAGVYLIMSDQPIPRIGGTDNKSILYIGKAKNLRNRVSQFRWANHTASGILWTHPTMARIVLNKPIRSVSDVEKYLGELIACYSTPINVDSLERAERALLFAYIQSFGEAPPLNMSLPRRWDELPPAQDLRWAENGLFG